MSPRIAIIGGGAGGVAMCLRLYEQIREAIANNNADQMVVEINVFEKSSVIGPGLPYASPFNCHLLNFPKKIMMGVFDSKALDEEAEVCFGDNCNKR